MNFSIGDPTLVTLGPGYVSYRAAEGTRGLQADSCRMVGLLIVAEAGDYRVVFPVASLVSHEVQGKPVQS